MKISNKVSAGNRGLMLVVFLFFQQVGYGQQKSHNAYYYFQQANIKDMVPPGHYTDSLIRSCIPLYSKAIRLKPNFFQAYRNRGRLYGDLKLYKNAISDLTQSIRYCGKDDRWYLHGMRGDYYYLHGEYLKAIKDYDVAIPNDGNPSYYYLNRAKSYWKLGLKDKACKDYANALKVDPEMEKDKEFLICN